MLTALAAIFLVAVWSPVGMVVIPLVVVCFLVGLVGWLREGRPPI